MATVTKLLCNRKLKQACSARHSQDCPVLLPRPNLVLGVVAQEASQWFNSGNALFSCNMDLKKMFARSLSTLGFNLYKQVQRHITGHITQAESNSRLK